VRGEATVPRRKRGQLKGENRIHLVPRKDREKRGRPIYLRKKKELKRPFSKNHFGQLFEKGKPSAPTSA